MCILAQGGLEDTGNNFFVFHVPINCENNSVKCFIFLISYMIFSRYRLKSSQREQISRISIFAECGTEVCKMTANGHIHMLYKDKAGAFHNTVNGSNSRGSAVHRK